MENDAVRHHWVVWPEGSGTAAVRTGPFEDLEEARVEGSKVKGAIVVCCPEWTLTYNIGTGEPGTWVGTAWEFYTHEADAKARYDVLNQSGQRPTKRPYYHKLDWKHLGAVHRMANADEPNAPARKVVTDKDTKAPRERYGD